MKLEPRYAPPYPSYLFIEIILDRIRSINSYHFLSRRNLNKLSKKYYSYRRSAKRDVFNFFLKIKSLKKKKKKKLKEKCSCHIPRNDDLEFRIVLCTFNVTAKIPELSSIVEHMALKDLLSISVDFGSKAKSSFPQKKKKKKNR